MVMQGEFEFEASFRLHSKFQAATLGSQNLIFKKKKKVQVLKTLSPGPQRCLSVIAGHILTLFLIMCRALSMKLKLKGF